MSFDVKFGLNGKKHNSTYVMNFSGTDPISCDLMENTDILNPAISLIAPITYNPTAYNYCWIEPFSRYYFITSWAWINRLWVAYCTVDVLASWKSEILLTSPYVLRSASNWNGNIIDTKYPEKTGYTIMSSEFSNPFQPPSTSIGCYEVAIANKSASSGVMYYFFAQLSFQAFMQQLYTNASYNFSSIQTAAEDISGDLMRTLLNPSEYIVSIKWLPYVIGDLQSRNFVTATTQVQLGWWTLQLSLNAYYLDEGQIDYSFTNKLSITIPKHPLSATRGPQMSVAHMKYILRFYPFGTFELDPSILAGSDILYMVTVFDIRSGHCILNLTTVEPTGSYSTGFKTSYCFKTLEAECSVNIPVASVTANPQPFNTSLLAGVSTAVANNGFSGFGTSIKNTFNQALSDTAAAAQAGAKFGGQFIAAAKSFLKSGVEDLSGIASAGLAVSPTVDIIGQQGTFAGFPNQSVTLVAFARHMTNDDLDTNGRPLCEVKTLNTLTGYVQTEQYPVEIAGALAAEIEEIENHYVTGFFLE